MTLENEGLAGRDRRRLVDFLFSAAYEELRRLASSVKQAGPQATVTPSTLVNEAWLKLANSPELQFDSKLHFKRIAARAMRQILVEAARRRSAGKRGGAAAKVEFDDSLAVPVDCDSDFLALNAALDQLERLNERQATVVEVRFFGGFDVAETAAALGVSEKTIDREWRAAKAWLASEIRREH